MNPVTLYRLSLQALTDNEALQVLTDAYEELGEKRTVAGLRLLLEMKAALRYAPFFVLIDPKEPDRPLVEREPLAVHWERGRICTEYRKRCRTRTVGARRAQAPWDMTRVKLWRIEERDRGPEAQPRWAGLQAREAEFFRVPGGRDTDTVQTWVPLDDQGRRPPSHDTRTLYKGGTAAKIMMYLRGVELNPEFQRALQPHARNQPDRIVSALGAGLFDTDPEIV